MKKRKLKIKSILILLVLLVIIALFLIIILSKDNKNLESIGYNKFEIEEIEKLSEKELDIIYKNAYNKNLIYIIKSENYDSNKLNLYLKYTSKYSNIAYLKIFELINNENFNSNNIDKYVECLRKSDNINGIIKYVNEIIKSNDEINENTINFISEKYFIEDYLDRYLNYYNSHSDLSFKEIVTRVNANIDNTFYENSNPTDLSKGMYSLINKFYYLDNNYVPDDLVYVERKYARDSARINKIAYENFVKMADYMSDLGMTLKITTAYRDYSLQQALYNNYVRIDGKDAADTYSARPGYSEHQFGYSADVTNAKLASFAEFEYTDEYKWLKDNAHKFGFILRYPKDKEYITGYMFESWHYRYVGVDVATYIYENNLTYEEYYAYFLR